MTYATERLVELTDGQIVHRFLSWTLQGRATWVSVPGCCPNDEHTLTA